MSNTKETWEITSDRWSFPLDVWWVENTDVAVVSPSEVPLTRLMREALEERLERISFRRDENRWAMVGAALKENAIQFHGEPEEKVSWSRESGKGIDLRAPKNLPFYEELLKTGFVRNTAQAVMLWTVIQRHIFNWLINRRQPVDFGFCVLRPLPFRRNWKEVMSRSITRRRVPGGGKTPEESLNFNPQVFAQEIADGATTMYSPKRRRYYWTIDVIHKTAWWKADAAKWKIGRKTRKNPHLEVARFIRENLKEIIDAYLKYRSETSVPATILSGGLIDRVMGRKGNRRSRGFYKVAPPPSPGHVPSSFDRRSGKEIPRHRIIMEEADAWLSQVRYLQQEAKDLRVVGRPVA